MKIDSMVFSHDATILIKDLPKPYAYAGIDSKGTCDPKCIFVVL